MESDPPETRLPDFGRTVGPDTGVGEDRTAGPGSDAGVGDSSMRGPDTGLGEGPPVVPGTGLREGPPLGPGIDVGEGPTMGPATRLSEGPTVAPHSRPGTSRGPGGATGPLSSGEAFGERYHIIRALGVGGMGAVYQAWDAELGMAVALKVIRPETTSDPVAAREMERRFKQELVFARQVTHKNVVRIHDLGEINGIKYITMPYLEGADLASVLKRQGKLAAPVALRLVRDVAAGLVAAHEAGIVHRDLKPANIMVVGERAVIMDFGIARSSSGGLGPSGAGGPAAALSGLPRSAAAATRVGTVLGTVEYMAPEQARGAAIDQRADIYALGLMFSDMLLGKRQAPPGTATAVEQLMHRLEHAPPPVRSVDPAIPEALDRLIARCVEPDREKRFPTSAALVAELDRLDENGVPIPVKKVVGLPLMGAVVSLLLALSGGVWWYGRSTAPVAARDPVSVLIGDIENKTSDPAFDHTLEPMLKRALEGAGFISAYDRSRIVSTLGVKPPEKLDEKAARELAVKQGLSVVLSGAIEPQGSGYAISVKASQTVTGNVIATAKSQVPNKDQVVAVATKLMATMRKALGDSASESAQMFAMASLSATSLDVVQQYAAAQEASSNNKFEEARDHALKAVQLDPKFGVGYQLVAVASRNLGNVQEAEKYSNEALRYIDSMTERERYATRGFWFRVAGDYPQCVKQYSELISRYAADVVGHNQLALCSSLLRDMKKAQTEMRRVVELLPKKAAFRDNLALYSNYGGDFQTGEKEARTIQEPDAYALQALAFAQLGQGQIALAKETYEKVKGVDDLGASFGASGLGDLATFEGRFSDAVGLLTQGAARDLAAKKPIPDRAAAKLASVAYAELSRGQKRGAGQAAEKALAISKAVKIRFLAARTFVETGEIAKARPLMAGLASELQAEPQAYAKIIEADIALKNKDARQAVKTLIEANGLLDTWIGHFDLGRAYLAVPALPQADSEFDYCIKRRGEALALFLDEEPTYAFFPAVYYYKGRVKEASQSPAAAESYRMYLTYRGESKEDPVVTDVRRRIGR